MTRARCAALALVLVAGSALAGWKLYWPSYALQREIRLHLVDPDSAQFRDVEYFEATRAACGLVNARNRMGGYVGFTEFVYVRGEGITFEPEELPRGLSTEERIEKLQKQLDYLNRHAAACPEKPAPGPAASAASTTNH